MTSMKTLDEQVKSVKEKQHEITKELSLINEREKHAIEERKLIFSAIEWIKTHMATKDDVNLRLKMIENIDEDLKIHVKETNASIRDTQGSINKLKHSQEQSMRNLEGSIAESIDKLKKEIMPLINATAQRSGDGLIKTALLSGKFTIVYAILMIIVGGLIGSSITHMFRGVQ